MRTIRRRSSGKRLWFLCSCGHVSTIGGSCVMNRSGLALLIQRVTTKHEKLYPACNPQIFRVASSKDGLDHANRSITWRTEAGERARDVAKLSSESLYQRCIQWAKAKLNGGISEEARA